MASYLTVAEFRLLSPLSGSDITELESANPGWLDANIAWASGFVDTRLRKRYEAPFVAPYPDVVTGWVCDLVGERAQRKRGVDPDDPQAAQYITDAERARAEIKEAADAVDGLFDLPLRKDTTSTGVAKGGTRVYSETSPYVGFSKEARTARDEDAAGDGSSG